MESGPTTSTDSPRASDEDVAFVAWSAATAAPATARSPTHCHSPRQTCAAPHWGITPFVADPTRISVSDRRSDATRVPLSVCNRCQGRPGRLEPFRGDLGTTVDADSVRTVLDAGERGVDRREQPPVGLLERVIDLAVDRLGRGVGHVLIRASRNQLTGLLLERAGVLLVEVVERLDDRLPFLQEQLAEVLRFYGAHQASRRSASSFVRPETSTVLSREP